MHEDLLAQVGDVVVRRPGKPHERMTIGELVVTEACGKMVLEGISNFITEVGLEPEKAMSLYLGENMVRDEAGQPLRQPAAEEPARQERPDFLVPRG